jgi:WD40 repeat protein/class 3 adenylate cyclase
MMSAMPQQGTTAPQLIKDRYEVLGTLGVGGEGRVVKALDRQHDRVVALKIRKVRDDGVREELLNEARILLAIPPHPALPLVREDFFDGEQYVVAMDWVDGIDLATLLGERGRPGLAPSSVLAYLAEAAEALTHLHSQHPPVIHGDVKPANLILTKGGHVKLVDFGLSSAPDAPRRRAGTPGFRAPELAADGVPSRASDVYSLAAAAFTLLSGSPPSGLLPSWEGIDPAQAEQLEAALRLGLATDPARRPATPGELVESLRTGWGAALPTGVMTFCLSDIEGSTELWDDDPAAMAEALVRHDEIIVAQVEARGGRVIKSMGEGDSTVSVFESAPQALESAVAATHALQAEAWPGGMRIAVRFGLHTGEAERRGADFYGPTLNLAARLRGQADGGHVFVSAATAALVARHLPPGCELVDLGPHRLRGLRAPERIHALKGPGIDAPLPAAESPYRGLLAFEPDDRRFFFGREAAAEEILARLEPGRLLAVIGASGSGKSSLLRAGVVGAAQRGTIITPGAEPPLELPGGLLVVDQFEELYTLCDDPARRDAFIDRLLAAAGPVAIAVRADLYGRLSDHAQLARAVTDNQILLGAMGEHELERVITEPARVAGLRLEPGLVDVILRDVAREPGALPLLSHALRVTWEQRDGRTLTVEGYRASGGVASAIAQSADSVVEAVPPDSQGLMRNLFLRLTELGEGVEDSRRRVAVDELVPEGASQAEVQGLLDRLAEARLVTLGEGTAEVAHEVLIREWPTLRAWLEEDRAGIRQHRELGDAARRWDAGDREPGDLYRGTRLAAAVEWAQSSPGALNAAERGFLDASVAESERERRTQLRVNRRLRVLLAGAGLLLVAAVIAGVLALREGDNARDAARAAGARSLGAQALIDDRLERSLLLAQAGRKLDDSVATRGYLLSALERHPAAIGVLQGDDEGVGELALTPDDRVLVTTNFAGQVFLFDVRSRKRIGRLQFDWVGDLDVSPDGRLLAVSGPADGPGYRVTLVDLATRKVVEKIDVGAYPGRPAMEAFVGARFAADGRSVIVNLDGNGREKVPEYLRRYDTRTGRPLGAAVSVGRGLTYLAPTEPAARDRLLIVAKNVSLVVDATTLRVRRRIPVGGYTAGLSPDGRSAALGYEDGRVAVLDLRTGKLRTLSGRHEERVHGLVFTADSRTLMTRSDDGKVLVWDLDTGKVRETLTGHASSITTSTASADGRTLYTGGLDGRVIVWDIAGDRRIARPFAEPFQPPALLLPYVPPVAISPSGRIVADGLLDGSVRRHDARTLRRLPDLPGVENGPATAVEFSPDGRTLAVLGEDGTVEVREAATGRRLRPPLRGTGSTAQAIAFSPDSEFLAVADLEGHLRVLGVETGEIRRSSVPPRVWHLAFSPDGRLLALAADVEGVELRDSRSLRVVARLPNQPDHGASWVRFSPDGRLLAVSAFEGYTQLWDVAGRKRVGEPLRGHEHEVVNAEFSPDGRVLATSSTDGTIILWDLASRRAVGTLPGTAGAVSVRFTPDGRRLLALRDSGAAVRWEISPDAWSQHACSVAGRELTRAEWKGLVPEQDYRRVCS